MAQVWIEEPGDSSTDVERTAPDLVDLFPAGKVPSGYLPVLRAYDYEVTITIVPDERIRELNRAHRGVDGVTDVLSFPLVDADAAGFVLPPCEPTHLGDVVVALEQARRQAEEYAHSFERELAYLTAHGVLHLLGYDHEREDERATMRAREEEILADLPR